MNNEEMDSSSLIDDENSKEIQDYEENSTASNKEITGAPSGQICKLSRGFKKWDPIYDYFKLSDNSAGCHCLVSGCTYEGKGRNVTTMRRHLENKHSSEFREYEVKKEKKVEEMSTSPGGSFRWLTNLQTSRRVKKLDPVYDYFQLNDYSSGCHCLVSGCTYEGKGRNVTTMKRHLENKHALTFLEYEAKKKVLTVVEEMQPMLNVPDIMPNERQRRSSLMTDNNSEKCYYDPSSSRAKELQKKFVYFVAVSNVTSSIVSDTAFVDFCAALDKRFKLPRSLQTLNSAVYDLKEEMKMQLREKLSTSQEVAVILDVIQICSDKYLGICANFYDPEDTTLKTVALTLKKITQFHADGFIRETVDSVLSDFEIPASKVLQYVADSGSNVLAIFNHDVFVDESAISDSDSCNDEEFPSLDSDTEAGHELSECGVVKEETSEISFCSEIESFPRRLPCVAHQLDVISEEAFSKENFQTLREKVQEFVNCCARFGKIRNLFLKISGKKPLRCAATSHWLSFYAVSCRLIEYKETVTEVAEEMCWPIPFSWDHLKEAKDLMKPMFDTITFLTDNKHSVVLPFVIPLILDLKAQYTEMKSSFFHESLDDLILQLATRFERFIVPSSELWNPAYLIATIMHPGQSQFLPTNLYNCGIAELKRFVVRLNHSWNVEDDTDFDINNSAQVSTSDEFPLFKRLKKRIVSSNKSALGIIEECEDYVSYIFERSFSARLDSVEFWKQSPYTKLCPLVCTYLAIPATVSSVAKLFAAASVSTSSDKEKSDEEILERRALLRFNRAFINFRC